MLRDAGVAVLLALLFALAACEMRVKIDRDATDVADLSLDGCSPACGERSCGDDGCGGSCGTCGDGSACDPAGICVAVVCGDGVIGPGEACDPPSSCSDWCDDGVTCTVDELIGDASSCTAECTFTPITACMTGDACCPSACHPGNDGECSTSCGDGVLDPGETCDLNCPTTCQTGDACQRGTLLGSAAACSAICSYETISACATGDGCCPPGCDGVDADCGGVCGNNVVEAGETCDGACPTSCDDGDACTNDATTGSAALCTLECTHQEKTSCQGGDSCCPAGCTLNNDSDCTSDCSDPGSWPGQWAALEEEVIVIVNQVRAAGFTCASGAQPPVGPVTMDGAMQQAARCHSNDMATNNFFGHVGSDGSSFTVRLSRAGFAGWPIAENIAGGSNTSQGAVDTWLGSTQGHCEALMNSGANVMGIGYAHGSNTQWGSYWTMVIGAQ